MLLNHLIKFERRMPILPRLHTVSTMLICLCFVLVFSIYSPGCTEAAPPDSTAYDEAIDSTIDFTDFTHGSIEKWLFNKGFELQKDTRNADKIVLTAGKQGLVIHANKQAFGLIMNKNVDIRKYRYIKIDWGIIQYPLNASWEYQRKNEALAVMVFFGHEKIDSGSIFIPNTPYFLSLFLGPDEVLQKAYRAKFFKESGRWVCLGNPRPGITIRSEYDLLDAYQKYFGKANTPAISAIAVSIDTSNSGNNGKAASFIKRIQISESGKQ